ncbi:hypothetical protein BJY59DRAFT_688269 [Rhodotorula toruloides]
MESGDARDAEVDRLLAHHPETSSCSRGRARLNRGERLRRGWVLTMDRSPTTTLTTGSPFSPRPPPSLPSLSLPTPQVVRYTALASGIVYGIVHRKTLQERFDKTAAEKEVQQRAHWLEEAKKAWEAQKLQGKSGVVTDPEAPNFDLEALLKSYEK